MRIAVVGATGRIGAKLTRTLLGAGHQVRALSRGGPALDALVEIGADPFIGSFDAGTGDLDRFFHEADAAFLMVKTDWNNIHGHYSEVALRFFDALRHSPVKRAVSLTAMGSGVRGSTGHFQPFYQLDQILNRLSDIDLVHLQAGWFMENLFGFIDPIVEHGRIAWSLGLDVEAPWVATDDIADFAAGQLLDPTGQHRIVHELGADYSMSKIADILSEEIGRPVDYRFIDRNRPEVEQGFLQRFGSLEQWLDDTQTLEALNEGRVRFHDDRPSMPTAMKAFIRASFLPRYRMETKQRSTGPKQFFEWMARDDLATT
ncbi:nucleoside-diphosphate sugar epimerase [Sphingomonas gei]|uniref:Nucleoside-diphosphate sugar epimerase n=1 Tax=Sphingomonas gei TaxID=1395960 RepID=A0A4S1XJ07_9SPHN|nr:NmrA family NAD(P)-binding protein [Sphingomonas gei]TGX56017.1 nucleoside-diphosphate sugar epimerase [Sphingomonas gei]